MRLWAPAQPLVPELQQWHWQISRQASASRAHEFLMGHREASKRQSLMQLCRWLAGNDAACMRAVPREPLVMPSMGLSLRACRSLVLLRRFREAGHSKPVVALQMMPARQARCALIAWIAALATLHPCAAPAVAHGAIAAQYSPHLAQPLQALQVMVAAKPV